jgi:hypothetical protein
MITRMKRLLYLLPFLAMATLLMMGCPAKNGGNTDGTDTTKTDTAKAAHDYGAAVITLERTVCFGRCPSYTLKIEGTGKVSYEGRDFVQVKGAQTSQIEAKAVKALVDEFFAIDYFALQDTFTEEVTDLPSTISSITVDGKRKQVYNYYGAPEKLTKLENRIDEVAGSAQWVKMGEEK